MKKGTSVLREGEMKVGRGEEEGPGGDFCRGVLTRPQVLKLGSAESWSDCWAVLDLRDDDRGTLEIRDEDKVFLRVSLLGVCV